MNGIPVYPHPKNGERPYLATPKPGFSGPIFGLISWFLASGAASPWPIVALPIPTTGPLYFLFLF